MIESAANLVRELRERGYTLRAESGLVKFKPVSIETELLERLRANKNAVYGFLLNETQPRRPEDNELDQLRKLCPALWKPVKLDDGRIGLVWGVSPYGVAVSVDPKGGILTLDPELVQLL